MAALRSDGLRLELVDERVDVGPLDPTGPAELDEGQFAGGHQLVDGGAAKPEQYDGVLHGAENGEEDWAAVVIEVPPWRCER